MGKRAPKAPDPWQTSAAQGAWNSFTAQQQQSMNMIGQSGPWGNLDFEQTGFDTIIDPTGKAIQVPRYNANTSLSPSQQAIFDQSQQAELGLAKIANEQTGKIGEILNTPFEFNNREAEDWAYDIASSRILPQQQQQQDALRTQLINQGIRPGTTAWNAEMGRMTNANTDQMNQLALSGRGMAFNEALAMRNQPLNEVIGLMSGSQIQNPNATFAQTPQSQVAGVDHAGNVNNAYNQQMAAYNSQMNALGGLFGLGGRIAFGRK